MIFNETLYGLFFFIVNAFCFIVEISKKKMKRRKKAGHSKEVSMMYTSNSTRPRTSFCAMKAKQRKNIIK